MLLSVGMALILFAGIRFFFGKGIHEQPAPDPSGRPKIEEAFLTPNAYSRPQKALNQVNGIVIHYTANLGSTAKANRNYFEGLKDSHETKASSHFVIGLEGEIIQCIPLGEIAYASNRRNTDTIAIECCHSGADGKFNDRTLNSLVQLTAWLCKGYSLGSSEVIRHYDITGKICPKYFVDHPDAWEAFRQNVGTQISAIS